MTMETNREKEARPKHQRKPYIPKEWITGVDKDEFLAIVDKHLPQKDYSNVSVGTWTKIGNEGLLEFGLGKEETQKRSWQDNIGYITKCYARETFGLEIPTQDKIRRAFKKLEGKPLFDNIDIKKIVEEVKERHLVHVGDKVDLEGVFFLSLFSLLQPHQNKGAFSLLGSDIDCREVKLRELLAAQLKDMIVSKIIREDLAPNVLHRVGYVDWGDGTTASSKKILLLTGGFLFDPTLFSNEHFAHVAAVKRTPILIMEAGENKANVTTSQQLLAQSYERLREPIAVSVEGKTFLFAVKPTGGKSDHHFAWAKTGNQEGGHFRCQRATYRRWMTGCTSTAACVLRGRALTPLFSGFCLGRRWRAAI